MYYLLLYVLTSAASSGKSGCLGATFVDNDRLYWAYSQSDRRIGTVKLFYLLLSKGVTKISAQFVEIAET